MSGAGLTGGDERVEAAARAMFDRDHPYHPWGSTKPPPDYMSAVSAALAAADAVAAQDPAPRPEPVAWMHEVEGPYRPSLTEDPAIAGWWRAQNGGRVVPLYRDPPTPAPIVPDEMDQATADLRAALADAHSYWDDAVADDSDEVARTRAREADGWRFIPPTGGAS